MTGKLPASWLGAFAMNGLTAITVIARGGFEITGQLLIDVFIYSIMVMNILFFFYVEAYTEMDPHEQARLEKTHMLESCLSP